MPVTCVNMAFVTCCDMLDGTGQDQSWFSQLRKWKSVPREVNLEKKCENRTYTGTYCKCLVGTRSFYKKTPKTNMLLYYLVFPLFRLI